MILALDMGNTNIVIGCIDSHKTYFVERVTTDHAKTGTEYALISRTFWKSTRSTRPRSRVPSCPLSFRR